MANSGGLGPPSPSIFAVEHKQAVRALQTKLHAFCPYYVPVRAILKVWTINQTPSDFTGDTLLLGNSRRLIGVWAGSVQVDLNLTVCDGKRVGILRERWKVEQVKCPVCRTSQ